MRKILAAPQAFLTPTHMAYIALGIAILCFSIGNVITKFVDVGPAASAFYRLFLAMPMAWAMLFLLENKSTKKATRTPVPFMKTAPLGIACGLFFGAEIGLLHYAFTQGSVGIAIFLNNFAPLFVILGSWLFLGQKPSQKSILCLTCAAPGAFLLADIDPNNIMASLNGGSIAALLSALCLAGFLMSATQLRKTVRAKTVMNWTNFIACLMLAPIAILTKEQLLPQGWEGWAVLLSIVIISQVMGMNLFTQAMGTLTSTATAFGALAQPVLTMVIAWFVLNETLTNNQLLGAVIVLGIISLNNTKTKTA